MASPPPIFQQISKCTVKPWPPRNSTSNICHLSPWDICMLNPNYILKGLLFSNLPSSSLSIETIIDRLKSSLSIALSHFYTLAGRLITHQVIGENNEVTGLNVSIECNDQGAEFIHTIANNLSVSDVLSPLSDVPAFVQSFFPYNGAINHDGHFLPLLGIQLTELSDGLFLACCLNHVVGDGTSYWHFFNMWAEIARSKEGGVRISRPPVQERWFIEGETPPIKLPYSHSDEFIDRCSSPPLRERFFHFSSKSIAQLKAKANQECGGSTEISSFQALSALVWRSITRARSLSTDQITSCRLAIQDRARLQPPLSPDYFGNSIYAVATSTTVGELAAHGLGWAALQLHQSIKAHTNEVIRGMIRKYHESPFVYKLAMFDRKSVMMGSSPRFDMYGCDFGWGRAVALRSGAANKFEGKVSSYPGREGGGSVDLEVCLIAEQMAALEVDEEFMAAVDLPLS